mgnify:CR=1 FL=1
MKFSFCSFTLNCNHEVILMKLSELAMQLSALAAQLDKAAGEIVAKIDDLETALADTEIPEEAATAIEELKAKAQALDDIVPDAPVE